MRGEGSLCANTTTSPSGTLIVCQYPIFNITTTPRRKKYYLCVKDVEPQAKKYKCLVHISIASK